MSVNSNVTFENIIVLLDMIEDYLRLFSVELLLLIYLYDIGKILNVLVCYGVYVMDLVNGWVNRCRLIEGFVATLSVGLIVMGG